MKEIEASRERSRVKNDKTKRFIRSVKIDHVGIVMSRMGKRKGKVKVIYYLKKRQHSVFGFYSNINSPFMFLNI